MFTKRLVFVSLLALVAGSGLAVGANALSKRAIDNTATIYFTQPDELGLTVSSPDERCEPNRVVLFRRVRQGPDQKIAEKTTKATGWAIKSYDPPGGGRFYGKVRTREAAFGTCAPATSGTTTVPAPRR